MKFKKFLNEQTLTGNIAQSFGKNMKMQRRQNSFIFIKHFEHVLYNEPENAWDVLSDYSLTPQQKKEALLLIDKAYDDGALSRTDWTMLKKKVK